MNFARIWKSLWWQFSEKNLNYVLYAVSDNLAKWTMEKYNKVDVTTYKFYY